MNEGEDSLAWAFDRSGNYTVKLSYRILMTQNERLELDGALNFAYNYGCGGGVALSATALLTAWCKQYMGITDPLIDEAFSLRDGDKLAKLTGFSKVIMETDCLEFVSLAQFMFICGSYLC